MGDLVIAVFTWFCFYYLRTKINAYPFSMPPGFYLGLLLYSAGWVFLHFISGAYKSIYAKSRLGELTRTIAATLIGCLVLLFVFVLKNPQGDNRTYYLEFLSLLLPVLTLTTAFRITLLGIAKKQLQRKSVFFNAVVAGRKEKIAAFYRDFLESREDAGYRITGFFHTDGGDTSTGFEAMTQLTSWHDLRRFVDEQQVEEVILAIDKSEREIISKALQLLSDREVNIKITPDNVDIITGALHTNNVLGVPLIDIHAGILPDWQQNTKRIIDIAAAFTGCILLAPLFIYTAIRVRLSSPGPIIFRQERIGFKGRPFIMYKFRSMYTDAEKNGPQLSHESDPRISSWGRIMRKWRLDELPQLWNILKGEMSLVGPRPERKFYIDQIVPRYPEFNYLFKVKPGLTSWGMVKYGYASSVEEMIRRMPYDLLYVENVSLMLDFKIMFYSIRIILSGKGK